MDEVVLISAVTTTKYSMVASLTFLVYDYLLNFDVELEFVWKLRWSFGKMLYLFNRYFAPVALSVNMIVFFGDFVTAQFCRGFIWWQCVSGLAAFLSTEIILLARIHAVYECNRKLLLILAFLCMVEGGTALLIEGLTMPQPFLHPFNNFTSCYADRIPSYSFLFWLPSLIFETILCLLMLTKTWKIYRSASNTPLLNLLIRDSILYFFSIFIVLLGNCLFWLLPPRLTVEFGESWAVAVASALGCRLLLNMRVRCFHKETRTTVLEETSHNATSSPIRFARGSETVLTISGESDDQ